VSIKLVAFSIVWFAWSPAGCCASSRESTDHTQNGAVQLSTQRADSCAKLRSIAHLGRNPGAHEDHVRAQGL